MTNRLENTLDIIMEHFKETEERIEEMIDRIEELEEELANATRKISGE